MNAPPDNALDQPRRGSSANTHHTAVRCSTRTLGRMRRIGAIVGMLAVVAMADADTVKGELSFNSEGVGKVLECKSGRIFALGTMATNPYLRLVQRYWRASFHGKTPVLIEVGGVVTGASTLGHLT